MKDAYYFSHDTNAFLDPKIRYLVSEFGLMAYGAFWIIIEMLASQRNWKIKLEGLSEGLFSLFQGKQTCYKTEGGIGYYEDLNGNQILIEDIGCYNINIAKIKQMLSFMIKIDLFKENDGFIWSDSLNERMEKRKEISKKRAEVGRIGGLKKGINYSKIAIAKQKNSKERKGKERKIKESNILQTKKSAKDKSFLESKELILYWKQKWIDIFDKEPAISWGKYIKLTRPHINTLGLIELKERCNNYFINSDEFFQKQNWSYECFISSNTLNKLTTK